MASSSSSQSCNYDVFLSFRGEDTRKTFVDHLYSALVDRKIPTYKDDETLPRGESIRPSLFKAIKGSRIAVIIFSKNYADSSWCLDELAYIMKCKDKRGLTVMPIFYDVNPSEIRKQKGDFGRGFAKQEVGNINKVESWRKALVDASEISGWEPKNIANGHESKVIKEIADAISEKLFSVNSGVDEDLVGMSTRLQELEAQLDIGSDGVRMVGVWGAGGSGKTTLAYSLYKKISHHFQGHCIIDNIREESSAHGIKTLQEKFLSRLLKLKMEVQSVEEGKDIVRSRLIHSNVLILLDDVDDCKQLDALAGSHNWFGSGSRVIITTRDEHLLRTHKVDVVCPVTLLSHEEASILFKKHAYNKDNPVIDYETLSSHVLFYAAGLPLALKVLGSFLYDKDEKKWVESLARLKDIPEMEIVEKLKISYDGLKTVEKELFLDIACFFRMETINDSLMEILEACGYHPNVEIEVLRQKCLITIENGWFDMHDLVQEMGHHIVRGEHPNDPKKHSRLWKHEEIENMCLSDATTESDRFETIGCMFRYRGHLSHFCKNVANMKKLRYLHVDFVEDADKNAKGPTFLSNELRCIEWNYYPRSPFPDTFKAMKLVVLKVSDSWQKKLWKGYKHLPHLKVLQLSYMDNLLSTPDFDGLPSLKKLTLHACKRLEKIHPSLGKHTSLEHVCIQYCRKIRMFPAIIHMTKLKTLEIKSWHKCLNLPEIKSNMDSLVELSLEKVGIDVFLPSVVERCTNLISLQLCYCFYTMGIEVSFDGLKHLEKFKLYGSSYINTSKYIRFSWLLCYNSRYNSLLFKVSQLPCSVRKLDLSGLKDEEIPLCIGEISNLEELRLRGNGFTRSDSTLSQLTRLKVLDISNTRFVELPKLPSSLIWLKVHWSWSLTVTGYSLTNCKQLCDVLICGVRALHDCNKLLESMLKGKAVENHCMRLDLEGTEIAKEFILIRGNRCSLKLPENWCNDFSGFLMCATVGYSHISSFRCVSMQQVMSGMESEDDVAWEEGANDIRTSVWYVSFASLRHTTWWNTISKAVSISFQNAEQIPCSGFGVRMVARKRKSGPTEISTTQEESEFSRYTPKIDIYKDSQYLLNFELEQVWS